MELKQTYTEEEAQEILLKSLARQDQMQGHMIEDLYAIHPD